MIRIELEEWCEKFLTRIFENSEPARQLVIKSLEEEWDEEKLNKEMLKLVKNHALKTYSDYKKELADFIEECAKELKK